MVVHVIITGFVQGVGFRRFVRHHASKLGLTGWIKNLSDNRVEGIFFGPKERIEKIISLCKKGPFLSEVRDIVVEWRGQPAETFETFEIEY